MIRRVPILQTMLRRGWSLLVVIGFLLHGAARAAEGPRRLTPNDLRWLNRITYGLDTATVERYRMLGRKRFLAEQLHPAGLTLPADLSEPRDSARRPLSEVLAEVQAEQQRIQGLPTDDAKQQARQAHNQAANQAASQAARQHLLRALWSPAQVQAQMEGFWLNHFSVFQGKANLRWMVGDFEARALRPHALGHFRDLLMATVTHPAMLVYLDNAQSAVGRINENYARELLELHTLGVDGGYTQQDVQELARVLTGLGVHSGKEPRLKPAWQALYLRRDAFEFNPARHDFGEKTLLDQRIEGSGFSEVEQVVDLLARHPATARFLSRKLATWWLGGEAPQALVDSMARTFQRSEGDIPAVLEVLFASRAFQDSLGPVSYTHLTLPTKRIV